MAFTFKLRGKTFTSTSIAEASALYGRLRDESGEGNSTFPKPALRGPQGPLGKFSYNGRVWADARDGGQVLIYDNRLEA
jgi:hypothetical protein